MQQSMVSDRDNTISILKGIGIILVVIGHSQCPNVLNRWIYSFHMPLFFIASGYLFKSRYFKQPGWLFLRRVKSIYCPFVKWSILFLLLHNVFYDIGVLNDVYGGSGRFSVRDILWNCVDVITKMTSYDYSICGAFWFFRSLFVGSVIFSLGTYLLNKHFSIAMSVLCITISFGLAGGLIAICGKGVPNWPQGGYRETMAVFFIGSGYYLKAFLPRLKNWRTAVAGLLLLCISMIWLPTNLDYINQTWQKWISICVTGIAGFLFIYYISSLINKKSEKIRSILLFLGKNSIYVFIFHILFFKPTSYLKIAYYELDWKMIGCHPVIPVHNEWFWIIYSIISLSLCAVIIQLHNAIDKRVSQS
mgnify:CR=1 FL=1